MRARARDRVLYMGREDTGETRLRPLIKNKCVLQKQQKKNSTDFVLWTVCPASRVCLLCAYHIIWNRCNGQNVFYMNFLFALEFFSYSTYSTSHFVFFFFEKGILFTHGYSLKSRIRWEKTGGVSFVYSWRFAWFAWLLGITDLIYGIEPDMDEQLVCAIQRFWCSIHTPLNLDYIWEVIQQALNGWIWNIWMCQTFYQKLAEYNETYLGTGWIIISHPAENK